MSKIDKSSAAGTEQRITRLLEVEEAGFLKESYVVVLGRGIDRAGETAYAERLKGGATRPEILLDLANSDEGRAHLARSPRLAAALMRVVGQPPVSANSIDALLALPDREFVEASVRLLLDQGTDLGTRNMLLARLRGGTPRFRMLIELATASGRTAFPDVAGLDALIAASRDALFPTARSLAELFALHDEAFIDAAYKTVLGRAPDFKGLAHYTERLRDGHSRSSVLAELAGSSEGRARDAALPGLSAICRNARFAKLPVLGGLMARLLGIESDSPSARRRRQIGVLLMRNYALQARLENVRPSGLSLQSDSQDLTGALLARQEALVDIQRDSFESEISALRKMMVQLMDQADRGTAARSRRSPARPPAHQPR